MNKIATDEKISNIQLIHIGEDYCKYSFKNQEGETAEVEITGYAQAIINQLGKSLLKDSFWKI
jgi:hypothetical protein